MWGYIYICTLSQDLDEQTHSRYLTASRPPSTIRFRHGLTWPSEVPLVDTIWVIQPVAVDVDQGAAPTDTGDLGI